MGPRTLIGFDGSSGAYDAVALARILAPTGSPVLVHVLPHEDPLAHHYELLPEEDSPLPENFFNEAVATLGNPAAEVRHYVGASPSHVLCDLAESGEFDFVVVGSPHRGVLGRALIGSVAEALLHGSLAPVALAPRDYATTSPETLRTIAVAFDATPEGNVALRQAEALALATGASLQVMTVVGPSAVVPKVTVRSRSLTPEPYQTVEAALDTVDEAVAIHALELIGPIAESLADACRNADLLVAGSRHYGVLHRVLAGSVSTRLVHLAPCPVMVVPRQATD